VWERDIEVRDTMRERKEDREEGKRRRERDERGSDKEELKME